MNFDSGKLFHTGINYIVAPVGEITKKNIPAFHQSLINSGIDVDSTKFENNAIIATQTSQPLNIRVGTVGPQVAQVLVVASNPHRALRTITQEINAVIDAFTATWKVHSLQILASDATIRYLYDSTRDHAFQELWEDRLKQPAEFKKIFGRSVIGGGLRFVMPPLSDEEDPKEIEVKIESFLRDPKQVFIDIQFRWHKPLMASNTGAFLVTNRLNEIENFVENQIHTFMRQN